MPAKPDLQVIEGDTDGDTPKPKETKPEKPYQPTPQEQAAIDGAKAKADRSTPLPEIKVGLPDHPSGTIKVRVPHNDISGKTVEALLTEAFQTNYPEAALYLQENIIRIAANTQNGREADLSNKMIAMAAGMNPTDHVEAMLAVQMTAIHQATVESAGTFAAADTREGREAAAINNNKFARTFAAQVQALHKYRTRGKQKIEVKHVTVKEGGQAIVGDVHAPGRKGPGQ